MGPRQVVKSAEDKLSAIFDVIANTDERRTRARKEAWEAVKRIVLDLEDEVKPEAASEPVPEPETPAEPEPEAVPEAPAPTSTPAATSSAAPSR